MTVSRQSIHMENVASLVEAFGLSHESEVPLRSFTIADDDNSGTVSVAKGKYKMALVLLYLAGYAKQDKFIITDEHRAAIRKYYGPDICKDAEFGRHTTYVSLRSLLLDRTIWVTIERKP